MRHFIRVSLVWLFIIGCSAAASAATTAEQLIELSRAGLSDDILIELIQSDGSTFQLTARDILGLHQDGLSDQVIRAMQATAKKKAAPPATAPEAPATSPQPPQVVNVYQTVTQTVDTPRHAPEYFSPPLAIPVYLPAPVVARPVPPVYWGWGGQRRPDSWDDRDPSERREPPATKATDRKGGL